MNYGDIREGIYNALCTIPAIQDTGSPPKGKVYWEWTAPADTVKPFLEMAFIGEVPSMNAGKCAHHMQLEVLCFGQPSNILDLDPVADAVVTLLNDKPILTPAGRTIVCNYIRDSRFDAWVEQLSASMIRLKFIIPTDLW
jgi:hypothetical protein